LKIGPLISSFYLKLPTDKQKDRQTDIRRVKHNSLGGGNDISVRLRLGLGRG